MNITAKQEQSDAEFVAAATEPDKRVTYLQQLMRWRRLSSVLTLMLGGALLLPEILHWLIPTIAGSAPLPTALLISMVGVVTLHNHLDLQIKFLKAEAARQQAA